MRRECLLVHLSGLRGPDRAQRVEGPGGRPSGCTFRSADSLLRALHSLRGTCPHGCARAVRPKAVRGRRHEPQETSGPWSLTRAPRMGHSCLTATGDGSGPGRSKRSLPAGNLPDSPTTRAGGLSDTDRMSEVVIPDRRGPDDFRVSRGLATSGAVLTRCGAVSAARPGGPPPQHLAVLPRGLRPLTLPLPAPGPRPLAPQAGSGEAFPHVDDNSAPP